MLPTTRNFVVNNTLLLPMTTNSEVYRPERVGFKPQQMCDLLGVGKETFRYWRRELDPNPPRALFSSLDLLIYRLIKYLVKIQEEPPKTLKTCGFNTLFTQLSGRDLSEIRGALLFIDVPDHKMQLMEEDERPSRFGFGLHYVPLLPVVQEHEDALVHFGQ